VPREPEAEQQPEGVKPAPGSTPIAGFKGARSPSASQTLAFYQAIDENDDHIKEMSQPGLWTASDWLLSTTTGRF